MDYKKTNAPSNTITRNMVELCEDTGNVYETVAIIGKRANQIAVEMKNDLSKKLQEFASYNDNLEEVFENREQIEISRYYEKLPKPTLMEQNRELEINEDHEKNYNYESKEKIVRKRLWKTFYGVICAGGFSTMIYCIIQIFKYGFYYLFLAGLLCSISVMCLGVYGFYKLWKNDQNNIRTVDSYDEAQEHTTLLDDQTTLLADDEKTVLLLEQPIGRLIPKNDELTEIVINDNGFIIGSCMEGTDYQIEGTGISRRHLRFYKEGKNICCEDLNSTNGVKINGRKISKCVLHEGDRIKIGLEEFLFKEE